MAKRKVLSLRCIMTAVENDSMTGFCRACGAEKENVEPDAEHYPCADCGADEVFGAEQLLMMRVG